MASPFQIQLAQARVGSIESSPDLQHYREMAARVMYGKGYDQLDAAAKSQVRRSAALVKSTMDVHSSGNSMAAAAGFDALYNAVQQPGAAMQISGARGSYGTSYAKGNIAINAATSLNRVLNAGRKTRGSDGSLFNLTSTRADAATEAQMAAAQMKKMYPTGVRMRAVEFGSSASSFAKGMVEAQKAFGADFGKGGSHEDLAKIGMARQRINQAAEEELQRQMGSGKLSGSERLAVENGLKEGKDAYELLQQYSAELDGEDRVKRAIFDANGKLTSDRFKKGTLSYGDGTLEADLSAGNYRAAFDMIRNGGMTSVEVDGKAAEELKEFVKKASPMVKELQDAFNAKDFNELQEHMHQLNMGTLNSLDSVKKAKSWMNRTKEYAEMMGITFEEAMEQQKAIAAGMPNMTGNVLVDIQRNSAGLIASNQDGIYTPEQIVQTVAQNTQTDAEELNPALVAMDVINDETHRGADEATVRKLQDLMARVKSAKDPEERKRLLYELEGLTLPYYKSQEAIDAAAKRSLSTEEGRELLVSNDEMAIKDNAARAAVKAERIGLDKKGQDGFAILAEEFGMHAAEAEQAVKLAGSDTDLAKISDPGMRAAVERLRSSGAVKQGDEQAAKNFFGKYKSQFLESEEGKRAMGSGGSNLDKRKREALMAASADKRLHSNAWEDKYNPLDKGYAGNFIHGLFNGSEMTEDEAAGLLVAMGSGSAGGVRDKFGLEEGKDYTVLDTELNSAGTGYSDKALKSIASFLGTTVEELGTDKQAIDARLGEALSDKSTSKLKDGTTMVFESGAVEAASKNYREKLKGLNEFYLGTDTSEGVLKGDMANKLYYDVNGTKAAGVAVSRGDGKEDFLDFGKSMKEQSALFKALGYSDKDIEKYGNTWDKLRTQNAKDWSAEDEKWMKGFSKKVEKAGMESNLTAEGKGVVEGVKGVLDSVFGTFLQKAVEGDGIAVKKI